MKRKITVVALIAVAAAAVAATAAIAVSGGGDLPDNRTAGHVVIGAPGSELLGSDPGSIQIAVESYSWGVSNTAVFQGGGGGSGRATVRDLTVVKTIDRASPLLARMCATAQQRPRVVLTVKRPGGSNLPYLQYTLDDVIVKSVQQAGSGDSLPLEEVTFTFREIEVKYTTREDVVVQTVIEQPE